MKSNIFSYPSIKLWIVLVILLVATSWAMNFLFFSEKLYYQSLGEQLSLAHIEKIFEFSEYWQWFVYAIIPLIVFIRVSFTTICLYTGLFLVNLKARFNDLFKVALLADFVFVFACLTKLIILIFFKEVNTLDDLQFQPLSLMELFNRESIDQLFFYPLSLISVFEALYWMALAWLLTEVVEKPFGSALKTVAGSYGTGLLLWVLFVMFLTVNLS